MLPIIPECTGQIFTKFSGLIGIYMGGDNGVDLKRLLGDIKEDWGSGGRKSHSGVRGGAPVGDLGDEVPQKLKLFL